MGETLHAPIHQDATDFDCGRPLQTPLDPELVPLEGNLLAGPTPEDATDLRELGPDISPAPYVNDDGDTGLGLARGILIGLLLVAPFWGAVLLILFR